MLVANLGTLYGFASTMVHVTGERTCTYPRTISMQPIWAESPHSGFPPTDLPCEQLLWFVCNSDGVHMGHAQRRGWRHACSAIKGILCRSVYLIKVRKVQRSEFPHRTSIYRSAARHRAQRLEQSRDAWRPRGRFRPPRSGARRTHAVPRGR